MVSSCCWKPAYHFLRSTTADSDEMKQDIPFLHPGRYLIKKVCTLKSASTSTRGS